MENRFNLYSKLNMIMAIWLIMFSVSLDAQQSMSLGALKFVMPTSEVKASSRIISMKMATTGISPKFLAKVGGVAFIQTATPDFTVNTLDLEIDTLNNIAYASINGMIYEIPLEVWELQSIVKYSSGDNNAAVTLYGDSESHFKYHEAFLDNLMGWRLLQADMFSIIAPIDMAKLPAFDDGKFVMSSQETKLYNDISNKSDDYKDIPCINKWINNNYEYESMLSCTSLQMSQLYQNLFSFFSLFSHVENPNTYIYTDYDQPIIFGLNGKEIEFDGNPYYLFATQDKSSVDTLEMYYEIKNFVDTFRIKKEKYKHTLVSDCFKQTENPIINKLIKLTTSNKKVEESAVKAFELTDFYSKCKAFEVDGENQNKHIKDLRQKLRVYADSIVKKEGVSDKLRKCCDEFKSIEESFTDFDSPILCAYAKIMYELSPTDTVAISNYNIAEKYQISYDRLLIEYMFSNISYEFKLMKKMTSFYRNRFDDVYRMNPIVFNAALNVCHWSAFFRYVKENYENEWLEFVEKVNLLEYDAPKVKTPIDYYFQDYLEYNQNRAIEINRDIIEYLY